MNQVNGSPKMDAPPSVETVCAAIATLYHNPDKNEKDKASVWLQALQKSVYAWKVITDHTFCLQLELILAPRKEYERKKS